MYSSEPQRDPLDDLLASARWPAADAQRLSRLQSHWSSLAVRPASRMRQVAVRCAAVAAALLLAVSVAWWNSRGNDPSKVEVRPPHIAERPSKPDLRDRQPISHHTEKPAFAATSTTHPSINPLSAGRPATPLEAAAFQVWHSQQRQSAWQQDLAVENAIAAIRYDIALSDQEIAATARPLLARRAYCERRLLESVRYFDGSRRQAALRLLAHVGTIRIAGELLPLVENERSRTAAAATLLQIVPPEKLTVLIRRERNPAAQRSMLVALITAGDARSVGQFLKCIAYDATRPVALQLISTAESLPTAALIGWLQSTDPERSAAAATALAHASDPAAIEAVVRLAQSRHAPSAALVALVGSQQPAAQSFVSAAQRSPLVAAVNEAQYQWRTLSSASSPDL